MKLSSSGEYNTGMKTKKKFNIINVEDVICQRLNLQSVQTNILNNYKVRPKLDSFKKTCFLQQFNSWNEDNQNELLKELCGPANLRAARSWIFKLINQPIKQ